MKLRQLYEQRLEKDSIQKKLKELSSQQKQIENQIIIWDKKYKEEKYDVEVLESSSIQSFFRELMGNKEEKLEKERKEAYEAKIKLDSYKNQHTSILSDIKYYEKKLIEIYDCDEEYHNLYNEKVISLKDNEINKLNDKLSDSIHQIKEINEACLETKRALTICDGIVESLNKAKDAATYDMMSRSGIVWHHMKYEALDHAQENIEKLQIQLKRMKRELVDVEINEDIKISIDSFTRGLDFWFDNIFTDYSVREKIGQSLDQAKNVQNQIKMIHMKLEILLENQLKIKAGYQNKLDKAVIYK